MRSSVFFFLALPMSSCLAHSVYVMMTSALFSQLGEVLQIETSIGQRFITKRIIIDLSKGSYQMFSSFLFYNWSIGKICI